MCLSHSNEHAKAADGIVADEPGWSELVILLSSRWTAKVKVNHWEQDQDRDTYRDARGLKPGLSQRAIYVTGCNSRLGPKLGS